MGHKSFLKIVSKYTADFLDKNTEGIHIIWRSPKMIWCLCMQILVRINLMSLKKTDWLQYLLEKRILCQENSCAPVANTTVFIKKSCTNIEIVSKGNNKKESCFCSSVYEKNLSHFGITIFWLGGEKLHHQKRKLCCISQITIQ